MSVKRSYYCLAQGCSKCGGEIVGVEYRWNHPNHYDGISEFMCLKCKRRVGRWTGNELKNGEFEPKYGKREVTNE